MGMQEALERGPLDRERNLLGISASADYRLLVAEKGRSILETAGIPGFLQELSKIISLQFTDVTIKEILWADDGTYSLRLRWDFRDLEEIKGRYRFSFVEATARPITGEVIIEGKERELLPMGSSSEVVGDAIAYAYHKPGTTIGPPSLVV